MASVLICKDENEAKGMIPYSLLLGDVIYEHLIHPLILKILSISRSAPWDGYRGEMNFRRLHPSLAAVSSDEPLIVPPGCCLSNPGGRGRPAWPPLRTAPLCWEAPAAGVAWPHHSLQILQGAGYNLLRMSREILWLEFSGDEASAAPLPWTDSAGPPFGPPQSAIPMGNLPCFSSVKLIPSNLF